MLGNLHRLEVWNFQSHHLDLGEQRGWSMNQLPIASDLIKMLLYWSGQSLDFSITLKEKTQINFLVDPVIALHNLKNGIQRTSGWCHDRFGRVACLERIRKFMPVSVLCPIHLFLYMIFLSFSHHSTGRPRFIVLHIHCASMHTEVFVIGKFVATLLQVYWHCFSNSIAHFGYLCHFDNFKNISNHPYIFVVRF